MLDYAWDLNDDGVFESAGVTVTLSTATLSGPGTLPVAVEVCDPVDDCDTAVAQVDVLNVPPALLGVSDDGPVLVGEPVTIVITATDPVDVLTYGFDCDNDGVFEVTRAANSADTALSVGDWVSARPGVVNARSLQRALNQLIGQEIIVPVWSAADGFGFRTTYETGHFARVRLTDYSLRGWDWITIEFLDYTVCAAENPPIARDDFVWLWTGSADSIDVLANDYDVDGDALTISAVTQPSGGVVTINPDRTLRYEPAANTVGTVHLVYTVVDDSGNEDSAELRIYIPWWY